MDCLAVRERIPEYVLSTLPHEEGLFVERHLGWCAACRKEADELRAGAASIGLALPQADPPPSLEERVVLRLRRDANRSGPRARRFRGLLASTVAAAMVAVLALGWGAAMFARGERAKEREREAEVQAQEYLSRLRVLIQHLPGPRTDIRQVQLSPRPRLRGGGAALVLVSPRVQDWVFVIVGGLPKGSLPYRVSIANPKGIVRPVGKVRRLDEGGGAEVFHEFRGDLRSFTRVLVRDRTGKLILHGSIERPAGAPGS